MPRFFRRLAEGVFDINDLVARTEELARFVERASTKQGFGKHVIAVGYSNGANMAASLLLLRPGLLAGAVLLRPMLPFTMQVVPDFSNVRILIESGTGDIIVPKDQPEALAETFLPGQGRGQPPVARGRAPATEADIESAQQWLSHLSGSLSK